MDAAATRSNEDLNRLLGAGGAGLRGLLKGGAVRPEAVWPLVCTMLGRAPQSLGLFFRYGGDLLGAREPGVAHASIFPLPWVPQATEQQREMFGRTLPSRAQERVLRRLECLARQSAARLNGQEAASALIREFFKLGLHAYGARQVVKKGRW